MKEKIQNDFNNIMTKSNEVALATCKDNMPNVRVVNYVYDEKTPGVIYFATHSKSPKVLAFRENNRVAFTTLKRSKFVSVKSATVKKSVRNSREISKKLIEKMPTYKKILDQFGGDALFFEIHFDTALVFSGVSDPKILYL